MHTERPSFYFQEQYGKYTCCNSKAHRFQSGILKSGCTSQNHRIKTGSPRKTVVNRAKNFEIIMEHFKIACEPYFFEREDPFTGVIETKQKYSDLIPEDKSLLFLVQ